LAKSEGTNAAVVASRVARASRDLDQETARVAAWRALGSMDLDLEERQDLESLLGEIGSGIDATSPESEAATGGASIELEAESRAARSAPVPDAGDRRKPEAWVDPMLTEEGARPSSPQNANLETVELADLVQVGDPPPETAAEAYERPEPIDLDLTSRTIRAVAATPIALERDELRIEVEGGAKKRLPLAKLEAISVAAVGGMGAKSVIVIDLVMNWRSASDDELKVVRLRGDCFDACAFAPDVRSPLDALRSFVAALFRESGATPLPDEQSANGMPFASFDDLSSYQGSVFGVEVDDVPLMNDL
jgi:hypothetical protein